eukprot:4951090-Amphidinium_carterae.1
MANMGATSGTIGARQNHCRGMFVDCLLTCKTVCSEGSVARRCKRSVSSLDVHSTKVGGKGNKKTIPSHGFCALAVNGGHWPH